MAKLDEHVELVRTISKEADILQHSRDQEEIQHHENVLQYLVELQCRKAKELT